MLLIMECCTSFLSRQDHRSDVVLSSKTYLSYDYFIFSSFLFICSKLNFGRLAGWTIAELTPWETNPMLGLTLPKHRPYPSSCYFYWKARLQFSPFNTIESNFNQSVGLMRLLFIINPRNYFFFNSNSRLQGCFTMDKRPASKKKISLVIWKIFEERAKLGKKSKWCLTI